MAIKKIAKMVLEKMSKLDSWIRVYWSCQRIPNFFNYEIFSGSDVSSIAMSPVTPPTEDDEKSLRIDTGSPPTPQKIPGKPTHA